MALHDRAFLEKIEQFLLHPTGLSPEEITQCLKSVQAHNGLAQLIQEPAGGALTAATAAAAKTAVGGSTTTGTTSKLALLMGMTRKYGATALILSLLGIGYLRFRQRVTEQLVVEYQAEQLKRRARRNTQVRALLNVIQDQQTQYQQAAALLEHRAAKVAKMQEEALAQQSAASMGATEMRKRHDEIDRLKTTLLQLKREVMKSFTQPPPLPPAAPTAISVGDHATKSESTKSTPATSVAVQADTGTIAQTLAMAAAPVADAAARLVAPVSPRAAKSTANDPATESVPVSWPVKVSDLIGGQEDSDELSTSRSYRLLLATS